MLSRSITEVHPHLSIYTCVLSFWKGSRVKWLVLYVVSCAVICSGSTGMAPGRADGLSLKRSPKVPPVDWAIDCGAARCHAPTLHVAVGLLLVAACKTKRQYLLTFTGKQILPFGIAKKYGCDTQRLDTRDIAQAQHSDAGICIKSNQIYFHIIRTRFRVYDSLPEDAVTTMVVYNPFFLDD